MTIRVVTMMLSFFLAAIFVVDTDAYVSKAALPSNVQLQFLQQSTRQIIESPPGELTEADIASSHHILKGWARLSKNAESIHSNSKNDRSKRTKSDVVVTSSKENAVAIENLLKRLVDETKAGNTKANPTTEDYNNMLEVWARSGEGVFAAERCEAILTQMQEQYETDGDRLVQPNLDSFKICLMAWKHAGGDSLSSFRAQRILEWMMSLYTSGKNEKAFPDVSCWIVVLQSWSRNNHKQAPAYAENLLSTMEKLNDQGAIAYGVRERTLAYNAVLGVHVNSSNSGNPKTWQRACDVLSFMESHPDIEPDRVSYHIVMGALVRSGDPRAASIADKILKVVENQHKKGKLSWNPDTFLFNSAMGCWAHSTKSGAYRKARSILDRQQNLFFGGCGSSRPDVYGFTSVLSACASEPGMDTDKAKAFNTALSTFQQLEQQQEAFGKPNHVTYGTMLKCVSQLLPHGSPERKRWTKTLFRQCSANGMVGDMVLARAREAASSPKEYKNLMRGHSKKTLPMSWTHNVNEQSQHRQKTFAAKRAEV